MSYAVQDGVLYGLLMFGPDAWYRHAAALDAGMFDGERREVFAAIAQLNHAGQASDFVSVRAGLSESASDLVSALSAGGFASKAAMGGYVEHLRQAWRISRARDIGAALADNGDAETAKADLLALEAARVTDTVSARDANRLLIEDLERRTKSDGGLRSGLADLDALLCGLEPSDLCVVAARPSMGKTAFMLNVAARCGVPAGIFSLEMSTAQLMTRLVAAEGVNYGRLRKPVTMTDGDWSGVTQATIKIGESGIYINDTGGLSIGALESEAYRMVKAHGIGLICVDYLQLVTHKAESRFESVSEVSRRLKSLAKNLNVPILAVSQMNRSVEKRGTPIPVMSDLRETGQIEQDADQIIFIHRPEVFVKGERPGEADIVVAKNRGGEIGTAVVAWQGVYQRFVNLSRFT